MVKYSLEDTDSVDLQLKNKYKPTLNFEDIFIFCKQKVFAFIVPEELQFSAIFVRLLLYNKNNRLQSLVDQWLPVFFSRHSFKIMKIRATVAKS